MAKDYYGEDAEISVFREESQPPSSQRLAIGAGLMSVSDVAMRLNLQAALAGDECGLDEPCQLFLTQVCLSLIVYCVYRSNQSYLT